MELTVVVRKEGTGYWSEVDQLPGCFAAGRTLGELREALQEAVALYLDDDRLELRHGPLRVGEIAATVLGQPAARLPRR